MAGRESFFWHKLHSLTGVIPTGFYLVQHLTLNSFALAGPEKFDAVLHFFGGMPKHLLLFLKFGIIWPALIFHAVYGLFIISRGEGNYSEAALKYRENRYYTLQRWSGIFAFFFLVYHMASTSVLGQIQGEGVIEYASWAARLAAPGGTYLTLVFYVLGIAACSYHFAYGIWNFCIRWGITISESAQQKTAKLSQVVFVVLTAIGILALVGFFKPILQAPEKTASIQKTVLSRPVSLNR